MSGAVVTYQQAHDRLCQLRCKAAGAGDTMCMEVCGEAGVDTETSPPCWQILEALGFEAPDSFTDSLETQIAEME